MARINLQAVEDIIASRPPEDTEDEQTRWKLIRATVTTQLAQVLCSQGKYTEALPLFQWSLDVRKKLLGPEHLEVAESLDAMAELFRLQGQYKEALRLKKRALHIREKVRKKKMTLPRIFFTGGGSQFEGYPLPSIRLGS